MKISDYINNVICVFQQVKHYRRGSRVVFKEVNKNVINVLGNGPSLSSSLPSLSVNVGKQSFFAVNDFAVSEAFQILRPDYYVLIDPAYFSNKTNSSDIEMRSRVYQNMRELVTWNMKLFVPYSAFRDKQFRNSISNKNIQLVPFNSIGFCPTKTIFYSYILKKNFGTVPVGNVLGAAIHIAINEGFRNINIFGADHTWTKDLCVNEKNEVCTIKRHFYSDGNNTVEMVPWHASDTHIFSMYEILQCLSRHFYGYMFLNWYASQVGARIVNYTPDSYIDAFERK